MDRILVVDDEPGVRFMLREVLEDRGLEVVVAASGEEALGRLEGVTVVVTDFSMGGMNGLELLKRIHERDAELPVLLVTAHGSERVAVAAMKAGAYDYLSKPVDIDELGLTVDRAREARKLRLENRRLVAEHAIGRRVVAGSPSMLRLLDAARRVADKDVTVLVRGETGTGKELVATLLHAQSRRAEKPLVRVNTAALPPELAESELFGHSKGAFTGATGVHAGYFARAHGGTLVLDEVGELPASVQPKLLRALQDGEIQPVGSGRVERVDVRVVACTHRDLLAEVSAGRFREDLYYRLAVVELLVPPLRERVEDVPELARELTRRFAEKFGVDDVSLSDGLLARLARRPWPGNVRELENTIARLVALHGGGVLAESALDDVMQGARPTPIARTAASDDDAPSAPGETLSLKEQVEAFERGLLARALAETSGNQSEAARRLGIGRATLIDKVKKYGLAVRE